MVEEFVSGTFLKGIWNLKEMSSHASKEEIQSTKSEAKKKTMVKRLKVIEPFLRVWK